MTFQTNETATTSRPVELYTFARAVGAASRVWRYAASDADVTLEGLTYRAATIDRTTIQRETDAGRTTLRVTVPRVVPVAADLLADGAGGPLGGTPGAAEAPLTVTIVRVHRDAAGAVSSVDADRRVVFGPGVVQQVRVSGEADGDVEFTVASAHAQLARPSLRVLLQRGCNWSLGDARCGLDVESAGYAWGATAGASGVDAIGPTLEVTLGVTPAVYAVGSAVEQATWFDGGTLVVGSGATLERIPIVRATIPDVAAPTTATLALLRGSAALAAGAALVLLPGCARTLAACRDKFGNARRFGGFPDLPQRNPLRESIEPLGA